MKALDAADDRNKIAPQGTCNDVEVGKELVVLGERELFVLREEALVVPKNKEMAVPKENDLAVPRGMSWSC